MSDPGKPSDAGNSRDVLGSLPSTRPQRRSPKRDGSTRAKPARPAARATRAARKPAGGAQRPAAPARKAVAAKAKPVAAQGYHPVAESRPVNPPSGAEILVSAVQAAGEVAQIGLTLGERLLRAAASRLPKP